MQRVFSVRLWMVAWEGRLLSDGRRNYCMVITTKGFKTGFCVPISVDCNLQRRYQNLLLFYAGTKSRSEYMRREKWYLEAQEPVLMKVFTKVNMSKIKY